MNSLKILLALILFLEQKNKSAGKQIKLIYEKEVSEHCRRRVMPSIFLGRQVIEANARILQFSRLELPYSCYISIRTESGSSMVMMIQVTSPDVKEACKNSGQLLVYEMGETFGGYWGPMPEKILRRKTPPPKIYTLKTTESTMTTTESPTEEDEETETTQTSTVSKHTGEHPTGEYVEVEVPLLNVSVHYVPGKGAPAESSDIADTFDLHHDVTPMKSVAYDTSILPLVQFRLVDQSGGRRNDDGDGEAPNYELDILQDFTPDMRLTLPQHNPTSKRRYKQRYKATRRLTFKKHRTLFHSLRHPDRRVISEKITRKINDMTKYLFPTTRSITTDKPNHTPDSWRAVIDLLKKLNKTEARTLKTALSIKEAKLLETISNMEHDKSAYLLSNLSKYGSNSYNDENKYITTKDAMLSTRNPVRLILDATEYTSKEPIPKEQTEIKSSTILEGIATDRSVQIEEKPERTDSITKSLYMDARTNQQLTFNSSRIQSTRKTDDVLKNNSESENQLKISTEETPTSKSSSTDKFPDANNKINTIITGSMVGHESWENLVQAAPEMAVLLNQTVADVIRRGNTSYDITKLKRMKKDIHSIAIENAQPHNLTTRKTLVTTTQQSFNAADMQEFAQLVELQDDELYGRVALRNVNQFVGPPLFNLCDIIDPTKPHVHLFNSSRIILSPVNFTLDRMVIILTAARALLSGELRCSSAKIECQVAGARVCLDSMVACDGVPNCGSYEIYDEDRLMCGHTAALQHNVYLAAFTFLAVLLTIIYAVHYWLKRCVPKVAEAFFVYSDGVENVLYLDSIMRSPHDTGEDPKMVYHSHMYGDDIYEEVVVEPHRNACQRFLRKLFCYWRITQNKIYETETSRMNLNLPMSKRIYSFTELEIRKMIASFTDTGVQTSDSIEMTRSLEYAKDKTTIPSTQLRPAARSHDFSIKGADSLLTLEEPLPEEQIDELSLLKFLNAAARNKRNGSLDLLTNSIESQPRKLSPEKKTLESSRNDSPSERELEIHTYDRHALSEPGPSRRLDDRHVPSSGSVSKHLRFEEITTTIPSERYSVEDKESITNVESRRMVVLGERSRRASRPLDTIEEADEHGGTKEHRHFWTSSKTKKPKKKTHVSLR